MYVFFVFLLILVHLLFVLVFYPEPNIIQLQRNEPPSSYWWGSSQYQFWWTWCTRQPNGSSNKAWSQISSKTGSEVCIISRALGQMSCRNLLQVTTICKILMCFILFVNYKFLVILPYYFSFCFTSSLWFIHLPSNVMMNPRKASTCLRTAYDLLNMMQRLKLQPTDEVRFEKHKLPFKIK